MPASTYRINDSNLAALMDDATFRREFPFLATAWLQSKNDKSPGCGTCGNKTKKNTVNYSSLRKAIATMPVDRKAKLKSMLQAKQVQVSYNNGNGKTVKLTF